MRRTGAPACGYVRSLRDETIDLAHPRVNRSYVREARVVLLTRRCIAHGGADPRPKVCSRRLRGPNDSRGGGADSVRARGARGDLHAGGKALLYVSSYPGGPYRVTVPLWKAGLIRGNVFVHNHPGSESFSAEDVWILLHHGAREVWVCGPERSFRMIASPRTRRIGVAAASEEWRVLSSRYQQALMAAAPLFRQLEDANILAATEAWAALTHGVVRDLSIRYGFAYTEF